MGGSPRAQHRGEFGLERKFCPVRGTRIPVKKSRVSFSRKGRGNVEKEQMVGPLKIGWGGGVFQDDLGGKEKIEGLPELTLTLMIPKGAATPLEIEDN